MNASPDDPNQDNWRKEIKAALDRAKRLVEKRLKGITKENLMKIINDIHKSIPWY